MLIGEYKHTLDDKRRLSLPVKFRKELGKKVVLTRGFDKCLFVYTTEGWEAIAKKLADLPLGATDSRGLNRFLLAGAVEADIDGLGRILVPDFLKEFAGLQTKVAVTGVGDRVEVWDEETWDTYKSRVESNADMLAEKLGDAGLI